MSSSLRQKKRERIGLVLKWTIYYEWVSEWPRCWWVVRSPVSSGRTLDWLWQKTVRKEGGWDGAITWKVHNNGPRQLSMMVMSWLAFISSLKIRVPAHNKTADPNQSRVIDHTKTISLNLARASIDIIHGARGFLAWYFLYSKSSN